MYEATYQSESAATEFGGTMATARANYRKREMLATRVSYIVIRKE